MAVRGLTVLAGAGDAGWTNVGERGNDLSGVDPTCGIMRAFYPSESPFVTSMSATFVTQSGEATISVRGTWACCAVLTCPGAARVPPIHRCMWCVLVRGRRTVLDHRGWLLELDCAPGVAGERVGHLSCAVPRLAANLTLNLDPGLVPPFPRHPKSRRTSRVTMPSCHRPGCSTPAAVGTPIWSP